VRVVIDAAGRRLDPGYDINLWEVQPEGRPSSIAAPLDPVDVEIDPLTYLAVA
jgi:hypothetical protein